MTEQGRRKYFLIHASQSPRAHAAMKEAMHRTRNEKKPKDGAAELLGEFGGSADVGDIVVQIARRFAGTTARWTDEHRSASTVQGYAVDETPYWLHEREALKTALIGRGWRVPDPETGKQVPLTFAFPAPG